MYLPFTNGKNRSNVIHLLWYDSSIGGAYWWYIGSNRNSTIWFNIHLHVCIYVINTCIHAFKLFVLNMHIILFRCTYIHLHQHIINSYTFIRIHEMSNKRLRKLTDYFRKYFSKIKIKIKMSLYAFSNQIHPRKNWKQ